MPDSISVPMPDRQNGAMLQRRRRVLFISNGHGEDLSGAAVAQALRRLDPEIELSALPIVGAGNSYRRAGIFCHCTAAAMPSGGFVYMSAFQFWRDIQAGLVGQTWQQLQAARQFGKEGSNTQDLVFATGDVVALAMALATGRDYFSYLVPFSAYYENRLQLPFPTVHLLRRRRCLAVFARDQFTAKLLHQQRVHQAAFVGNAFMDVLATDPEFSSQSNSQSNSQSKSLACKALALTESPVVALLPGSRLPECGQNLRLMLDFYVLWHQEKAHDQPLAWYAAITPSLLVQIPELLTNTPWQWELLGQDISQGIYLWYGEKESGLYCVADAFGEILQACSVVIGMAGTAIEQAVGLGKPVITFVGAGPQFTYRFAEAQQRLLGDSIYLMTQSTNKTDQADATALKAAIPILVNCVYDAEVRRKAEANGKERIGGVGGAMAMAQAVLTWFQSFEN